MVANNAQERLGQGREPVLTGEAGAGQNGFDTVSPVVVLMQLFKSLRAYQWSKNLLLFAALVFARQLHVPDQLRKSVVAFLAFCAASSAMYLLNDILDVNQDRLHPEKCKRPIAGGNLPIPLAGVAAVVLGAVAGVMSWYLGRGFLGIMAVYVFITVAYSLGLKNVFLLDVLVISIGFVIRALAGAVALDVAFSNWLMVCTLFLALFLSLSKRRHEIQLLEEEAVNHREVLGHYTVEYLDSLNLVVACATLITYTIYTCSPEVVERLGTDRLYLTLPFVVYGLFRYLYLLHVNTHGGDPARTLIKDKYLAVTVLLWGVLCIAIIYGKI
ncbi:MAG: decaprenyl-phosphate phosphoribosyltransferase [Candidatus Hydrogenedentes bacterium]|nr:decaprenyl-phosphate phosphoribosyltransferase [Candidatus Hydrogenedentota bacterium]